MNRSPDRNSRRGRTAEVILTSAASGIGRIDRNECTLDDFLDTGILPEYRRTAGHLLLTYYRYAGYIRKELSRLVRRPPENKIRHLLLAAMTQIRFQTGIARESAVSIAVDAARSSHADKFVNAVLRRFIAEDVPPVSTAAEILPPAVFNRWKKRFSPEELDDLARLFQSEPPFTFRMEKQTEEVDFDCAFLCRTGNFDFYTASPALVLKSRALQEGKIYIQDPATGNAPSLPDYTSVKSALDLCAAPGGKSLMISERLSFDGKLTAFDRSRIRQKLTLENFQKRNLKHLVKWGDPHELAGVFDLVLADVPCSNTGVFRHRPDALWRFSVNELQKVVQLQTDLLEQAARLTVPGGQLVYSTCSIEPEENQLLIDDFLIRHPEFELLSGGTILPSGNADGSSAFLLRSKKSR